MAAADTESPDSPVAVAVTSKLFPVLFAVIPSGKVAVRTPVFSPIETVAPEGIFDESVIAYVIVSFGSVAAAEIVDVVSEVKSRSPP